MKLCIAGLWHLGCVTAACMAKLGVKTVGLTETEAEAAVLNSACAPVAEPGLNALLAEGVAAGNLSFSSNSKEAIFCDYLWVCYDTPVDGQDRADEGYVLSFVKKFSQYIGKGQGIIISSQLPVGSVKVIESYFSDENRPYIACSPENLRLGDAIRIFLNPDRIVVGVRDHQAQQYFSPFFQLISDHVIWMRPESAEMTKHALNGFFATSIAFINEIASLCESVGADAEEVSKGLLSERRIGAGAYLKPGSAYGGGTLARDIAYLLKKGEEYHVRLPQICGTDKSNCAHKDWCYNTICRAMGNLAGKRVLVLGLTYKEGTDTLRRSLALEMVCKLEKAGCIVTVYDPDLQQKPKNDPSSWKLTKHPLHIIETVDCVVVAVKKTYYRTAGIDKKIERMEDLTVIDENGYFKNPVAGNYFTIGRRANKRAVRL